VEARQAVSDEFWTLRGYLRFKGAMNLELEKHIDRMEGRLKSFVPSDLEVASQ
jgi:hypothetical protein